MDFRTTAQCSFLVLFYNVSSAIWVLKQKRALSLSFLPTNQISKFITFLILSISLHIYLNSLSLVLNPSINQHPSERKGVHGTYFQQAPQPGRITRFFCSDTFTQGSREDHSILHSTYWCCRSPSPCWAQSAPLLPWINCIFQKST